MQLKLVSEKDKKAFNKVAVHPLQSWEWGEFRKAWGNEVVRLGIFDPSASSRHGRLVDAVQVIFSKVPKTNFKIGTVIKGPKPSKELLTFLKKLADKERAIFIKLEPNIAFGLQTTDYGKKRNNSMQHVASSKERNRIKNILQSNGCVSGKTLFTPTSFWIDLTKSEEELMKSFNSKTRYNIRLATKKGVKVVEDSSEKAFEKYLELMRETVERQGFYAHTEKYHRLMWKHLNQLPINNSQSPIARLLTAKYKGEIITCWIVFVWHDFLYYPYGASSTKHKNVMANNLMMWEAIQLGKKLGLKTFDLWGREEGKGFTKFKEGYGPQVVEFLGSWDLISSPLYYPYRLAESLRWKLLRFKNKFTKPKFKYQ